MIASAAIAAATTLASASGQNTVKTELLTLSTGGVVSGYYFKNNGVVAEICASPDEINGPVSYSGPRTIAIYPTEKEASAKTPPKAPLSVTLPPDTNRTLIVFTLTEIPDKPEATEEPGKEHPKAAPVISVKAYGISNKTFGAGDYRVFNTSSQEVRVGLDDTEITLAADEQKDIKGNAFGKEGVSIKVHLSAKIDNEFKRVYSSMWGHRPERRVFLFLLPSDNPRRSVDLKSFYDLPSIKATRTSFATDVTQP